MNADAPKVFICYRREETAAHAGRLYDALVEQFGEPNVFMDIELEPGIDFVDHITRVVGSCHVLLVILGPTWATLSDGADHARIADEEDFVRLEVETALRRSDVRVIPLLVGGARMPHSDELPEPVRGLTRRNAFELSDLRWRYDVGRLTDALAGLLSDTQAPLPEAGERAEESRRPAGQGETAATVVAEPADAPPSEPTDAPPSERPPTGKRFARSGETAPHPPDSRAPPPTRRWLPIAAGAALVALVGVAIALLAGGGGGDDGGGQGDDGAQGPRVIATIPVGGSPDGMAVDGNLLWVTDQERNVLRRVNTASNKPSGPPIPVGRNPDGVAAEDGIVWVASLDSGTLTRFHASDDGSVTRTGTVDLPGEPEGVSLGKQLVWVTTGPGGTVARIDRADATAIGSIDIGLNTVGVFVGEDNVYVSDKAQNSVTRIDPVTAVIRGGPTRVGKRPRGLVEAEGSVWVANSAGNTVSRIDASTGRVQDKAIPVGRNPRDVTFAAGLIWVANTDSNTVTTIDARTGRVTGDPIPVGTKPASVTAGAGSVWVSNSGGGTLSRLEP
jgi:YVTN family beta-propeller protein